MTAVEKLYLILTSAAIGFLLGFSVAHAEDLTNVVWIDCYDGDTCNFGVFLPAIFSPIGVRFSGIDTPEINGKCAKEKALAIEARDFLVAKMEAAKSIVVQHVSRDARFRIDGTVVADGINLNKLLIEKGYAVPYNGTGKKNDWCAP